jgi:hypothetical protein
MRSMDSIMAVRTGPGQSALTRTPWGPDFCTGDLDQADDGMLAGHIALPAM